MITLVGSLFGFLSSASPYLINIWQERSKKKHDLILLKLKLDAEKRGKAKELEIIQTQCRSREVSQINNYITGPTKSDWIDGIRASVRPTVTYLFFVVFSIIKITTLVSLIKSGNNIITSLDLIWDVETQILFSTVISFWFGQRAFSGIVK